jgi:hypothetical protein
MNVGQKVWYFPQRGYSTTAPGREVRVLKVARKWIYLSDGDQSWLELKIDRDQPNASQEGYTARDKRGDWVGKVYTDMQHKLYASLRIAVWKKVKGFVSRCVNAPDHVTLKDIRALAQILGVELDEPTVTNG